LLKGGRVAATLIVEQVRDRAKQIPEQVPRSLLSRDRQVNLVEINHKPEGPRTPAAS
jgi:hypothetical protein